MLIIPGVEADEARLAAICDKYGIAELRVSSRGPCGEAAPDSDIDILYTLRPGRRLGWDIAAFTGCAWLLPLALRLAHGIQHAGRCDIRVSRLGGGAFGISRRVFSALASTLTVTVLTIYFLADLPRLPRSAVLLFPRALRARFGRITDVMVDKVGSYMIGNILISLVAGLAAFGALRVPFAVPLAFLVAVTDLIPMVGATIAELIPPRR